MVARSRSVPTRDLAASPYLATIVLLLLFGNSERVWFGIKESVAERPWLHSNVASPLSADANTSSLHVEPIRTVRAASDNSLALPASMEIAPGRHREEKVNDNHAQKKGDTDSALASSSFLVSSAEDAFAARGGQSETTVLREKTAAAVHSLSSSISSSLTRSDVTTNATLTVSVAGAALTGGARATMATSGSCLSVPLEDGKQGPKAMGRLGCNLGCTCAWYNECYLKFSPDYLQENVGVCQLGLPLMMLVSLLLFLSTAVCFVWSRGLLDSWEKGDELLGGDEDLPRGGAEPLPRRAPRQTPSESRRAVVRLPRLAGPSRTE